MHQNTAETTSARMGIHWGNVLLQVASTYETVLQVVLEQIQNALDANARAIEVIVNLKANQIYVRDNGDGVTDANFRRAISLIGRSQKTDKLGRFGIGLICPLGKCAHFTFTSCPKPYTDQFREWRFVTDEIRRQEGQPEVPVRDRPDICLSETRSHHMARVWWNTEVHMAELTEDRLLRTISMSSLIDEVNSRFGTVMNRLGTAINARITSSDGTEEAQTFKAHTYTGEALAPFAVTNDEAGETTFRLFVVRRSGGAKKRRKGIVSVGAKGDLYKFPFSKLARQLGDSLDKGVKEALSSGLLEGEIECELVELNRDRERFERTVALSGFAAALDAWFIEVGSDLIAEEKDSARDERHQELGLQALRNVERWLEDPEARALRDVIGKFQHGTTGNGHTAKPSTEAGQQSVRALSTRSGKTPSAKQSKGNGKGRGSRGEPQRDKPGHSPNTVVGPKGQKRNLVQSHSLGLQIAHERLRGANKPLWELDETNGIITFNVLHPLWSRCEDKSDPVLTRLQEDCVIQALTLLTMPEQWREHIATGLEEYTRYRVLTLVQPSPAKKKRGTS